jgi:hypothetical protein
MLPCRAKQLTHTNTSHKRSAQPIRSDSSRYRKTVLLRARQILGSEFSKGVDIWCFNLNGVDMELTFHLSLTVQIIHKVSLNNYVSRAEIVYKKSFSVIQNSKPDFGLITISFVYNRGMEYLEDCPFHQQ